MILAASLMAAVALTSCNNNDFVEDDVQTGSAQLVEIKVGQEVQGIETKGGMSTRAAISTGDQVEATIIATNGEKPADWGTFVPVTENTFATGAAWSVTTFANVSTGTFEAGSKKAIGLNPTLYANPATGSAGGATLTGVAPKGTVAGGKVSFGVFDGQQDVMVATTTERNPVVSGNMDAFALTFNHKTAQLRFRFAAVNNAGTGAWTEAKDVIIVKSVTVKKTNVPSAVKLADMEVEWTKTAADLLLGDLLVNTIPTTFGTSGEPVQPTKPDFMTIDKVAMVKPGVAVELNVLLTINGEEKAYTAIKPLRSGAALTTVEGKFHNISLTIKQPAKPTGSPLITATATVTEWVEGDEGTAEL